MSKNPLMLATRFLLELALLAALAVAGWRLGADGWRYVAAFALPAVAATLWGVFRVPNDGGPPTVQVPGTVRLLLEIFLFGAAVAALYVAGLQGWALALGGVTLLHYLLSWDRVAWLLRGAPPPHPQAGS